MHAELEALNFTVIAVALDSRPAEARPWIEAARPTYPCLIDVDHRVADLYNMLNVPEAVWIDEQGRIVRPPEPAGAYEGFRKRDRQTFAMPEDAAAITAAARQTYFAAVRDWAAKGGSSEHALSAETARNRIALPGPEVGLAHAHFVLGQQLLRLGRVDEATEVLAEASRLHPESWTIWRQAAPLDTRGFAATEAFWARVDALGEKRYYPKVDLKGMP
jgi:hypothetical protein